ncbi:Alpha/Beta hydrolase protein [Leptodontidium sp. 2 PMI_412]|nr:Alpha/Beta hydrolase protein [Leptodontidium sp. 2 PMI_412]
MERKEYVFKQVAGGEGIDATVWYKADASTTAKPIVFYVHGGNFIVGHKDLLSPDYAETLLDLGFGAVVSPNYRLSPTISAYDGAVTDTKDAYNWTINKLPAQFAQDTGVKLDPERIVAFGHSAGGTLALLTASSPKPPKAILDIFGMKYLTDEFYHTPNPALAKIPDFDQDFLDKIFAENPPPNGAPPPFGPKGPDFSKHRAAWLFDSMKRGTYMKGVIPDGKYDRVDPATIFSSSFPPTYFIHGAADTGVPARFSEKAHAELKEKGVETELVIVDGAAHGFDAGAKPGDEKFAILEKGFKFLKAHV